MTYRPALMTPYISPDIPVLTLPKAGSGPAYGPNVAGLINAAIAAALASGRNALKITETNGYCETSIQLPTTSGFSLIGLGRAIPGVGANGYAGGVKINGPYGSGYPAIQFNGATNNGNSLTGAARDLTLENIHFASFGGAETLTKTGGPVALIDIRNGYKVRLNGVSAIADYQQLLRIFNTWDSDIDKLHLNGGGCCDPTVTADSSTVQGYTGRSFLPVETAIGRSLGVPMVELISPNTTGADVDNNLRFRGTHIESNGTNGLPLLVRGGNGNNVTFDTGSKIEATDGCMPMIVLQDQGLFDFAGKLFAGGTGSAPGAVGSIAAGTAWKGYGNPGIVLAHNCTSPRFAGSIGYSGTPGTGSALTAMGRFIGCTDPQANWLVENGLTALTPNGAARLIFDACTDVSASHTHCYAPAYLTSVSGANTTERTMINGSNAVA